MEHGAIESLITKAAQLVLFTLMLGMGLSLTIRQVSYLWSKPGLLTRTLLASFVLVPIVAAIVVQILPLSVPMRIGIGLMAITPGAPVLYYRISKMGRNTTFAASYQVTVALLAILFLPAIAAFLSSRYPNQGFVTSQEVFKQVLFAQLIPLAIGLAIRAGLPDVANDLEEWVGRISHVMFLSLGVLILIKGLDVVLHAGVIPILAIALMAAASILIGHLLGGPDPTTRTTFAIANATRNAGLALVITVLNFTKQEILPVIIIYALISAIATTLYDNFYKRTLPPVPG